MHPASIAAAPAAGLVESWDGACIQVSQRPQRLLQGVKSAFGTLRSILAGAVQRDFVRRMG